MKAEPKVLLAVFAHPDDESFGTGGTLAYYARNGVKVYLICATRGEAGDVSPEFLEGYQSISERRESELRCAAGILGLEGVYFLNYRDSGMPGSADNHHPDALVSAPVDQVAAEVSRYIRQIRPQVVMTFDPIGGYKHPDHIAIHRATVQAFTLAGDPDFPDEFPPYQPQKLYFHVFPKGSLRLALKVMKLTGKDPRHFGRNGDIDLVSLAEEGNFPTHVKIDIKSVKGEKDAAAACHASQLGGGPPRRGMFSRVLRWWDGQEQYMRAYPPAEPRLRETDLFSGISFLD